DAAMLTIHAVGVGIGILVARILVIPIHHPEGAVGTGLCGDGAEPWILRDEEIAPADFEVAFGGAERGTGLGGFEAGAEWFEAVQVERALVDVAQERQPLPRRRELVALVNVHPSVRRAVMLKI